MIDIGTVQLHKSRDHLCFALQSHGNQAVATVDHNGLHLSLHHVPNVMVALLD